MTAGRDAVIRILYVLPSLDIGGIQRHLLYTLRGLDRTRFRCLVAFDRPGEIGEELGALGIPMVRLAGGRYRLRDPRGWFARTRQIQALAREAEIDILHSQTPLYGLFGTVAGWRARCPVRLLSIHGHWLRPHDVLALKVTLPLLTAIVEGAPGVIDKLVARGYPASKFRLVHYGVDATPYGDPTLGPRARAKLGLPAEAYVVTRVARCFPDKGVDDFVSAAPDVLTEVPAARFLVVGDGDELPALRAQAARLGVGDRVTFTGYYADLPDVIAASDVVTMTSRVDELSLVTPEAFAAGKPVVAFCNGAEIAGAIADGHNGVLLPPGDVAALSRTLVDLFRHADRRRRMGQAALGVFAARYDLTSAARAMATLYEGLLEGAA